MTKWYAIIITIVIIAIVSGALLYHFTPCEEVDVVTFGMEIEVAGKFKINPQTTKVCKSQNPTSIPQNYIDELKSMKVAILRSINNISTLGEEISSLERQISYILDYPEDQRSQWQKENLPIMQRDLERSQTMLEYEKQQQLPKLTNQFEEKIESIKVIAKSQDAINEIASQVNAINFYPLVELDQKVYTWTDKVYFTIIDPMSNLDYHKLDTIGGRDDRILKVETKRGVVNNVILMETGVDTGIFTTEIILSGFVPYDVDGDGNLEDASGKTWHYAGPGGEGRISAGRSDFIKATYEFLDNEKVEVTAKIDWNIAEIQFLEYPLHNDSEAALRVVDIDANLDPESIDRIPVSITSSSDPLGFEMYLTETNEATAIFEGTLFLSSKTDPKTNTLRVKIGDNVTASYIDRTLPEPYSYGESLEVISTMPVK